MSVAQIVADPVDDLSSAFGRLRPHLRGLDGESYRDVRSTLTPRWGVVWLDVAATWGALATSVTVAAAAQRVAWPLAVGVGAAASVGIGVAIHRLGQFVHEGVHGNVARPPWNDLVTNALAGLPTVTDVRDYRPLHLAHHRFLGTGRDPERTYWSRVDVPFILRAVTGIYLIDVVRRRRQLDIEIDAHRAVTIGGLAFHASVTAGLLVSGRTLAAAAWLVGAGAVYPLVQALRQVLEHRSDDAVGNLTEHDDHVPFTRMFSSDPLGPVFGGAGFDRHLIHHWDPGVSYTRLGQLERWLRGGTAAEPLIAARRATYGSAFRRLWRR